MNREAGVRAAARALLAALSVLGVFHVLVILRVLPASAVWGGQAGDSPGSLMLLESIGLVVTVLFGLIVAIRAGVVRAPGLRKVARVCMWIVFGYFVLNTFGNLTSPSSLEKAIFTPVSAVLAVLALVVAAERTA